jgi:hypothetical protein
MAHVAASANIRQRLASRPSCQRFLSLMFGELGLAAEPNSSPKAWTS